MMRRAAVALLAVLGGCTLITDSFLTNDFSGDPFPIGVDTSSGAVLVGMHPCAPADDCPAVLDLLSPFTLVDPRTDKDPPSLSYVDLTLLGKSQAGTLTLPRARFPEVQLISLHPCPDVTDPNDPSSLLACNVGTPGNPSQFDAVIGADALAGDAVRLRLDEDRSEDQIFVLPDVGGSDRGRTLACDGVFGSPYRGGGTLVISGTELPFGNRRITLQACLGADPDPDPQIFVADQNLPPPLDPSLTYDPRPDGRCRREQSRKTIASSLQQRGANALFVVSTSTGISILGAAAYERYVLAHPEAQPLDALPTDSVYLPSGQVMGRRATIDRISLVAASSSNALAPCRQIYAHRLLSALGRIESSEFDRCTDDQGQSIDVPDSSKFASPCKDGSAFCPVPSILELTRPAGIDVLVVDDTNATLQALRAELRPDQPEVDGILGTDVLRGVELDVDYPHDRVLARCPGGNCIVRPSLAQDGDRCQINRCVKGLADVRNHTPMGAMAPDSKNLPGCAFTPPN